MKTTLVVMATLILASAAGAEEAKSDSAPDPAQAAPSAAQGAAPAEPAPPPAEPVTAKLDALYKRRDASGVAKQLEELLARSLEATPDDPAVQWRAARWYFWQADTAADKKLKERLAKKGWEHGDKALEKAPDDIEARYWTALSIGVYGDSIGIVSALSQGIEGKFRKHLDYVVEKKPGYDHGGALVTLGRYYFTLPWPKKDDEKATAALKRVLQMFPDNLRARVFLAEGLLEEDDDNAAEAKKLIAEVLAAKPGSYDAPEERFSQKLAKALTPKIEEALK